MRDCSICSSLQIPHISFPFLSAGMQSEMAAVRKGCLPLLNATTPPKRLFSYSLLLFSSSCARSKGLLTVASSRFCPLLVPLIFDMSWYHPFTECPSAPSVEGTGTH